LTRINKADEKPMQYPDKKVIASVFIGFFAAVTAIAVTIGGLHYSSTPEFCITCHEMRIVAEHGWMNSPHYANQYGVAAECSDCHVPPETELVNMLWVKTRDGAKDVFIHYLGESEPHKMEWERLRLSARKKIHDSSCRGCHQNLVARGFPIKAIIAHREYLRYQRMPEDKRCLDCHSEEFHGGFKQYLYGQGQVAMNGGER